MSVQWIKELSPGAIRNCNISLDGSPFSLRDDMGGTNESESPVRRLRVSFTPRPVAEMWIYGNKKILTPRKRPISEFFAANGITDAASVKLKITETAPGNLIVEKA
jgi:hypothetical protein